MAFLGFSRLNKSLESCACVYVPCKVPPQLFKLLLLLLLLKLLTPFKTMFT